MLGYFPNIDKIRSNISKSEFHSYTNDENKQDYCDSNDHMVFLVDGNKLFGKAPMVFQKNIYESSKFI